MSNVDTFKLSNPEIEAEIYYLSEEEGGRKTAVGNGYRGQFYYNGKDWDAPQQFKDKVWCNPGETVRVQLQTLSSEYHVGQIKQGMEFETREGSKTVGRGKVLKVLRDDFMYWDQETFIKNLDKDIKPYSGDDLLGFRIDFDGYLTETEIIDDIQIEITERPECMILVKCTLLDKDLPCRQVGDRIIECWKNDLRISNHLYKADLQCSFDDQTFKSRLEKFTLTFATWSSIYLTGQIIVTR
jgi:hypothetical protein